MNKYNNLVIAIPHARHDFDASKWDNPALVQQDADRWTDHHTDKIFKPVVDNAVAIVGGYSRFECDLERLLDDPLESIGQGIAYTRSHSGATRFVDEQTRNECVESWHNYRNAIEAHLGSHSLIVDAHSFPSDLSDVDVCIGFNEDATKPTQEVLEAVFNHFADLGYKVAFNDPYGNAIAPKSDKAYHSLMIEFNKRIYMNEKSLDLRQDSYKLHYAVNGLYKLLLGQSA